MPKNLFALLLLVPLLSAAQPSVVGTWELRHVAPQDIANTTPRGVSNMKMHFTESGKMYMLAPAQVSIQDARAADYTFDGKKLKLAESGARPRIVAVSFPDDATMVVTQDDEPPRTFKKIPGFAVKLEPKSLQLVTGGSIAEAATYDEKDYSRLAPVKRIVGSWEVIAYERVPRSQVPPFGFLNDLWTITPAGVRVVRRGPQATDSVSVAISVDKISASGIALGGPAGTKIDWTYSFNEWGHLVLDSPYCRIILKLLSKDTDALQSVPVKVVLLTPQ